MNRDQEKAMFAKKANGLSKKQLFDMGAELRPASYHGGYGEPAFTCQKCGSQSDSLSWFLAHKKTHPNFDQEHHFKISARLRDNPQYRLRMHHELGHHKKFCSDMNGGCMMEHLGKYKGRLN